MLTADRFTGIFKALDASPWNAATGRAGKRQAGVRRGVATPLYTPDERRRRDSSVWQTACRERSPIVTSVKSQISFSQQTPRIRAAGASKPR